MPKFRSSNRARRNTMTIRLAFHSMDFDVAKEWVAAYRELIEPSEKLRALEKAMEFVFPKIGAIQAESLTTIEMEMVEGSDVSLLLENKSTEELLSEMDKGTAEWIKTID